MMSPLASIILALIGGALFLIAPLVIAGDIFQRTVEEMRSEGIPVRWWFGAHAIYVLRSRLASASRAEERDKCRRWWRNMKWSFGLCLIPLVYLAASAGVGMFLGLDSRLSGMGP